MTIIGSGQAFLPSPDIHRRTIRAPQNPLDKSTVVSIYPREIRETKETVYPGRFFIPAGSYEKPAVLVVGSSSWWRDIDPEQPLLEIPNSSIQMAESIVVDYCNGLLGCDMGESRPGLFFLLGPKDSASIKKDHKAELDIAQRRQKTWYEALVKMADIYWARTNGNPLAISEIMRLAATELGMDKDWNRDQQRLNMVRCKACGTLINDQVVVCPNCKVVLDAVRFKELGLQFAG